MNATMPANLRVEFDVISHEVAYLHLHWKVFNQLFNTGEETILLLHSSAHGFFSVVEDSLKRDVILGFCRLIDPPSTGKLRKNLTFERLINTIPASDSTLTETVRNHLTKLRSHCAHLLDWRNKKVAHADLEVSLGRDQLPPLLVTEIVTGLVESRKILNTIDKYYGASGEFEGFVVVKGGVELLLQDILDARRYRDARDVTTTPKNADSDNRLKHVLEELKCHFPEGCVILTRSHERSDVGTVELIHNIAVGGIRNPEERARFIATALATVCRNTEIDPTEVLRSVQQN